MVVHTNAAYCRLTGIDSHQVVGKSISSLLSISDEVHSPSVSSHEGQQTAAGGETERGGNVNELAAAEAAGRARASRQNRSSLGLERLIASSGFGQLHAVHVHMKPQNMLGKNVTIVQYPQSLSARNIGRNRDEGSNDTSLTGSYDGPSGCIRCLASIAPVVQSPAALDAGTSDKEGHAQTKQKRRKVHESETQLHRKHVSPNDSYRKHQSPPLITHYVIQVQPDSVGAKHGSEESLSSNSTPVEARLLGLTKEEFQRHNRTIAAAFGPDVEPPLEDDALMSESTEAKEPVSAVG